MQSTCNCDDLGGAFLPLDIAYGVQVAFD